MSQFEALQVPARNGFAITKHDTNYLAHATREIYVGGVGDVAVLTIGGDTFTFKAVPTGTRIAVQAVKVLATGTSATDLVGLY